MDSLAIPISAPTLLALHAYLHRHPAAGSLGEVVDAAINAWLARQNATQQGEPGLGYQWKSLFLPAGTQVRFDHHGHTYHAEVRGDHLVYDGRPTSPRGMLMQIAGLTGNAWRLLRVRRPGDKHFHVPIALRAKQSREDEVDNCSPEHALVRRMVDALGRIETAMRERRAARPRRGAATRERRGEPCRREGDASALCTGKDTANRSSPGRRENDVPGYVTDVAFDGPVANVRAHAWPPIDGRPPVQDWGLD